MTGSTAPQRILPQFIALSVIWGASFLFIKVALDGLSPTQIVVGRLVLGAMVLIAILVWTRQRLPSDPGVWGHLAVVAALQCVPFLLFAWATGQISSGLASIYNATVPLLTMVVGLALLPEEHLTRPRLVGLLIGLGGVGVIFGVWDAPEASGLLAQLACLVATVGYGLAFVYLRRYITPRGLGAIPLATVQIGLGAVMMLAVTPLIATEPIELDLAIIASMVALGAGGTGLAYIWNTNIVAGWGATNASTVTYLIPVVGVTLGIVVLGETLSWNQPVGALIVVLGIVISQDRLTLSGSAGWASRVRQRT